MSECRISKLNTNFQEMLPGWDVESTFLQLWKVLKRKIGVLVSLKVVEMLVTTLQQQVMVLLLKII